MGYIFTFGFRNDIKCDVIGNGFVLLDHSKRQNGAEYLGMELANPCRNVDVTLRLGFARLDPKRSISEYDLSDHFALFQVGRSMVS